MGWSSWAWSSWAWPYRAGRVARTSGHKVTFLVVVFGIPIPRRATRARLEAGGARGLGQHQRPIKACGQRRADLRDGRRPDASTRPSRPTRRAAEMANNVTADRGGSAGLAIAALTACGGSGGEGPNPSPAPVPGQLNGRLTIGSRSTSPARAEGRHQLPRLRRGDRTLRGQGARVPEANITWKARAGDGSSCWKRRPGGPDLLHLIRSPTPASRWSTSPGPYFLAHQEPCWCAATTRRSPGRRR